MWVRGSENFQKIIETVIHQADHRSGGPCEFPEIEQVDGVLAQIGKDVARRP